MMISHMRLSVNIESPEDIDACGQLYYPTDASKDFVHRVADAALSGGAAHTLQGPFGVGKSSLAAFALNELGHPTKIFKPKRASDLFATEGPVAQVVQAGGLASLPTVGTAEPLLRRVAGALKSFGECAPKSLASPAVRSCRSINVDKAPHDAVLQLLAKLAEEISQRNIPGVLLIIDEFGRHLDYMLKSPYGHDLHFLQDLAELTGRAKAPLSLLIIQHYGLEHYSGQLPSAKRAEWEKVKGRFRETVLHNTETDSAHILSKALPSVFQPGHRRLRFKAPAEGPELLQDKAFLTAARKCHPLHPMTVALLSRLSQLLGQQDRTTIGWMTSDSPTGFSKLVLKQGKGIWVYPDALFDHFLSDPFLTPANPVIAKRFAAVYTAYERGAETVSNQSLRLLKTLALLNFAGGRGLFATKTCLTACLPINFPLNKSMSELITESLVIHRRYKDEYVVWEGSDYDVDRRVYEMASAISLDFAAEMNRQFPRRVLAHRHLVETGHRRSAPVLWLNESDAPPPHDGEPRVLIWAGSAPRKARPEDVAASAKINALTPHLLEASAIQHLIVEDERHLQGDTAAMEELQLRLYFHETMVASLYENILASKLKWNAAKRTFPTLQHALSEVMKFTYPCTFILHNELINHTQVSGQVMAGLRRLLEYLCSSPEKENLGIEKFPPERIIYESLLKQTRLHKKARNGWVLRLDAKIPDANLAKAIREIRRLFSQGGNGRDLTISNVAERMEAPPFGVKRTPAILLCILVLLVDRDKYELSEDLRFLPDWRSQTLLRLLKTPSRFSVSASAKVPVSKRFMQDYQAALIGSSDEENLSPLAVVRGLLVRHSQLSEYAKQTSMVSDQAQAFRRAIRTARSPGDMLFHAIPQAMGIASLTTIKNNKAASYFRKLKSVQREFEKADEKLLSGLAEAAMATLAVSNLKKLMVKCQSLAQALPTDGFLHHDHHNFIKMIVDNKHKYERAWFKNIVDFGLDIAAPIESWSDSRAAQAEILLRQNLLGLQSAGEIVSNLRLQADASPFAVFWPNANGKRDGHGLEKVTQGLEAIVRELPESLRMSAVVELAKSVQGDKP